MAATLVAPRFLPETARHPGRLDVAGALTSPLGVSALVFGIVHSADAGWTDPVTRSALVAGATGDTPMQAGLAFLPATIAAFAGAAATSRLFRRAGNAALSVAGRAAMLIDTAWISRVSADSGYLAGALGLGILVTIFVASGSGAHGSRSSPIAYRQR